MADTGDLDPEEKLRLKKRLIGLHKLDMFCDLDPDCDYCLIELRDNRSAILTIDGGGYHAVWPLVLLDRIEAETGLLSYELFDLVAGDSSGAITSGLLASKVPAAEILNFWLGNEGRKIFSVRNPVAGAFLDFLFLLGMNNMYFGVITFLSMLLPPVYSKRFLRPYLKDFYTNDTLKETVLNSGMGLFILSKDVESGNVLPAGCVPDPANPGEVLSNYNYETLLTRANIEGSGSPPGAAQPLGTYVDGGDGIYGNPTLLIIRELAQMYETRVSPYKNEPRDDDGILLDPEHAAKELNAARFFYKYLSCINLPENIENILKKSGKLGDEAPCPHLGDTSVAHKRLGVFSLGTAYLTLELVPESIAQDPLFPSITWGSWLWNNIATESTLIQNLVLGDDKLFPHIDLRRFDCSLNRSVMVNAHQLGPYDVQFPKIPGIYGQSTGTVTEEDLSYLSFLIQPNYMPFYIAQAKSTYEFLKNRGLPSPFSKGTDGALLAYNPNLLIDDPVQNQAWENKLTRTLGNPNWLDSQPVGSPWQSYFCNALPAFRPPFYQTDPGEAPWPFSLVNPTTFPDEP